MNYRLYLTTILIIFTIATLYVSVVKPKLHNKVLVYNSDYIILEPQVEAKKNNFIPEKQYEGLKVESKIVNSTEGQQIPKSKITKESDKVTGSRNLNSTKSVLSESKVSSIKKNNESKISQQNKSVQNILKKDLDKKSLIEQQEEIEWNKWRSNLQNQIMKDVDFVDVPQGVIFKFTFDVDKYGKISNIKTWSMNSGYTPHAIQYILPVIKGYQGHSILNFPSGSKRSIVRFEGGIRVSNYEKLSTPKDYNDIEKVIK